MEAIVIFKNIVWPAEGRNGYFKQSGISISDWSGDKLHIHGITSKGDSAVGHILLPKEHIQDLIDSLEKLK